MKSYGQADYKALLNKTKQFMESADENEGGGNAVLTNQEFNELKNDINALRDTNISKELLNTLMALIIMILKI